ncbi:Ecdysteroid kinase-like family [Popillia japonica]|uniref:Ecdysteroid kinase-like family n=1 Tax=Popillia japonica TaxID=7064 RepID=A0AAW1K2Q0_POPJA
MTVDLPLCPEDVNQVLQEIIAREKFQNPTVVFSQGSKIGQGFLGVDTAVEITEGNRKLELFVKTAPKHEKFRELMHIRLAYCNEFRFYNTIYAEMDKFHQEKTGRPMNIAAKYCGGSDEEMKEIIVMENVKVEGFSAKNLREPLDKDHIVIMMKTYAKLHGTSFAFKDQRKEVFEDVTKDIFKFLYTITKCNFEMFNLQSHLKNLEKFLGSSKLYRVLKTAIPLTVLSFMVIAMEIILCCAVIHGDCNGNNFMFRNKDGDLDLRLIDFQASSLYNVQLNIVETMDNPMSEEEQERFLNDYWDREEFARRMGILFQHLIDNDFI